MGLPTRCKTKALLHTLGSLSIERLIQLRQMNFLHSFSFLPSDSLHRRLLVTLIKNPPAGGILPRLHDMLQEYGLPSMEDILAGHWSKEGWKRLTKRVLLAVSFSEFMDDCDKLPLAQCSTLKLGRPIPHLNICKGYPQLTKRNNIRMRLLVRCYGLEVEVSRFRHSQSPSGTCKLCVTAASDGTATSEVEDTVHFISSCPALSPVRNCSLPSLGATASLLAQDPIKFTDVVLGAEWIDDPDLQREFVDFIHRLHLARTTLLTQSHLPPTANLAALL